MIYIQETASPCFALLMLLLSHSFLLQMEVWEVKFPKEQQLTSAHGGSMDVDFQE